MAQKDFFISYNGIDQAWAEWIAWVLEEAKYDVVIQAWDFPTGGNFVLEMHKAAQETEATVLVLSQNYLDAEFTHPEWSAAFVNDPQGNKRKLLPFRVGECQPQGLLKPVIYTDLLGLPAIEAKEAVLKALKTRTKPTSPPKFPAKQARVMGKPPRFPGALPPIWNVPHNRNQNFTGRVEFLEKLRTTLSASKTAAVTQAITGLGGIGKTQTAIEYAYRHSSEYNVVWWVKSEKPETLAADYAALAQELNLPEKDLKDQPAIIKAVRTWFGQHDKWLLIFDNAEDPQEIQNTYVPQGGNGHVLITSRNPNWGATAQTVGINTLEEGEAVEFLLKRTGENDQEAATALAKELGKLPLALEQAAAYILATGISLSKYVELAKEYKVELLKEGDKPTDYPDTVLTTWNLSFQKIQEENPAASDLLKAFAFLAPDDIPLALFDGKHEELPPSLQELGENELVLNQSLGILLKYSLVERQGKTVSLHRLVQTVLRNQMDEEEKESWDRAMVKWFQKQFPFYKDDPSTWKETARYVPHAIALLSEASDSEEAQDEKGNLASDVGRYHHHVLALFDIAHSYYRRALEISESTYGLDHPKVATGVNNLGGVLQALGDLEGAKAHYERAFRIDEAAYGPDHPRVAIRVNNLGVVLKALGDLEGAKAHYERALRIDEAIQGPNHPDVAIDVNNLGDVLQDLGDLEGARAHYERALRIGEATYGLDHPKVAIRVNNLGAVLKDLGDLEGAKAHYERAFQIDEVTYGPNHPTVAIRVNNLGTVLKDLGDLEGARAHFERALEIFSRVLGEEHPNTKIVREHLESF